MRDELKRIHGEVSASYDRLAEVTEGYVRERGCEIEALVLRDFGCKEGEQRSMHLHRFRRKCAGSHFQLLLAVADKNIRSGATFFDECDVISDDVPHDSVVALPFPDAWRHVRAIVIT